MHQRLFFLACFFIWTTGVAQQYSFTSFTIEDGLTNDVVYSTHQDRNGYLWIATHDGLNRYDGYEFKKFLHNPFDKKSLASNMTIDMTEDHEGGFWILTNTHLHRYKEKDESFERYILPVGSGNHSNQSASKMIDGNKRFLLLNLFNGLFVFDKINKQFTPIGSDSSTNNLAFKKAKNIYDEKPDLFNFPFFKDKEGNVLIGAGKAKGVLLFDSAGVSLQRKLPDFYHPIQWHDQIVTSIYRNKKNTLVYCLQEGNKFFLVTKTGKKHFLLNRSITGINLFIESMEEDERGDIWLGYGNHLFEYLPDVDSVIDLSGNLYNTPIGDHFIIKSISIDNFSNLWLGLYESGILKASIRKSLFLNFAVNQPGNFKLPNSSISSIIKNPDETVIVRYFGTQVASLIDVTAKKIVNREFKFNPLDTSMMYKLFPQFNKIESSKPFFTLFDPSTRFTFNNGEFGLYKDRQQEFWAFNFNELKRVRDSLTFNIGNHINSFYEGDDNTFWIGTEGNGLLKLNYKTGELKTFLPDERNPNHISSQYVEGIIPLEKKGLWLATRYGLNYFDFHTGQFKLFSEQDGLCNNTIYTIEKDKEGKLWLGTSNGLSCYDPRTNDFTNYSRNNGLVNSEYNRYATVSLSNGWILMGGTKGLDVIIPDSIKFRRETEKKQAPLRITSFRSPDSVFYSFADPIHLSHQQNNVVISFAALDYTQPGNNKYTWKLEPIERKWTYGTGKHEVNYASLPPGNYLFKIKAAGSDGIWNDKEISLAFVIAWPWWQSWWFLVSIFILGIGLLVGSVRLYYNRKFKKQWEKQKIILEKQQAVEKERTRIATDIHDDLGSGLSRIRYLGETVKHKTKLQENVIPDIEKISQFSDEMVDKMNEIVWALNEKNDTLESMVSYIRLFAVEYLSANNLHCHISLPDEIPHTIIKGETRRNIFLSVKESLHNIVKHADATEAWLSLDINPQMIIRIRDNGKGINPEKIRPFSNGIMNITKRMKEAGGTVEFKNEKGTTVILKVPFL